VDGRIDLPNYSVFGSDTMLLKKEKDIFNSFISLYLINYTM